MKLRINSIWTRLLVIFSLVFLMLLLMLLSITRVFFTDFYIRSNERNMAAATREFIGSLRGRDMERAMFDLKGRTGANVIIYLGNGQPTRQPNMDPLETDFMDDIYAKTIAADAGSYFELNEEIGEGMLVYGVIMPRGEVLVLTKTMGLLREAQIMFNAFITRVAVVVYIVGLLVISLVAYYISRPIVRMHAVTGRMAALDFSEELPVRGKDEIGELMSSINTMAFQLSESIHDLEDANDQLEDELSKERSLEKMRRKFVSDVSHELKNPLAMIMGYADGLKQGIPKTEESQGEYYDIIIDEASRMNTLVKDLLDLSGYESGTFTISKETFVVNDLFSDAIERFSYVMKEKKVNIEYDEARWYEIYADRIRINQVIVNILSNAFKHVDGEGTIGIDLKKVDSKVAMTISNTGKAIPKEALDRIWDSFYQVDMETSGNGLGLAIVKSIVQLHDGRCRAYVEGGFNCFEVII